MPKLYEILMRDTRANQPAAATSNRGSLYCVTDESDILEQSDGSDWLSYSPTGGGGDLTLVEHKTTTANTTTVTFSSLDGNTDGTYKLQGKIIQNGSGTAALLMRPNGATTNLLSSLGSFFSNTNGSNATSDLTLLFTNASGQAASFEITIHARKNANSVAQIFTYNGTSSNPRIGTSNFTNITGGAWDESSTNVTSIDLVSGISSGIGSGSEFWLYKYGE